MYAIHQLCTYLQNQTYVHLVPPLNQQTLSFEILTGRYERGKLGQWYLGLAEEKGLFSRQTTILYLLWIFVHLQTVDTPWSHKDCAAQFRDSEFMGWERWPISISFDIFGRSLYPDCPCLFPSTIWRRLRCFLWLHRPLWSCARSGGSYYTPADVVWSTRWTGFWITTPFWKTRKRHEPLESPWPANTNFE